MTYSFQFFIYLILALFTSSDQNQNNPEKGKQDLAMCSSEYPDSHAWLIMGSHEIFLDHLPRIYHENHHYQLVSKATFPDSIKNIYLNDYVATQDSFYMLVNKEKFILPEMASLLVNKFNAIILKSSGDLSGVRRLCGEFEVKIESTIRFRTFPEFDTHSDTLSYFLFGNEKEVFVSNNITVQPDFYVTSILHKDSDVPLFDPELGIDLFITNYMRKGPCQKPSDHSLDYILKNGESGTLKLEKHVAFATAEVNQEDPCK